MIIVWQKTTVELKKKIKKHQQFLVLSLVGARNYNSLLSRLLAIFPVLLLSTFSSAKLIYTRCWFDEDGFFDYGEKREKKNLKRETGISTGHIGIFPLVAGE